jgi:hypothetical protein
VCLKKEYGGFSIPELRDLNLCFNGTLDKKVPREGTSAVEGVHRLQVQYINKFMPESQ